MRPENFDINQLIEALRDTASVIDWHLPEGMEYEDLTKEDHAAIDAAIFECNVCGWWYDVDHLTEGGGHDKVCTDCYENDTNEDDEYD